MAERKDIETLLNLEAQKHVRVWRDIATQYNWRMQDETRRHTQRLEEIYRMAAEEPLDTDTKSVL